MAQPVVHFEILGRDAAALRAYYRELFGWSFTGAGPGPYARLDPGRGADGAGIGGGIGAAPAGYPGHVTFYVRVPEVEAALAQAERLGGRRVMGPHAVAGDTEIGQFTDPEGHLIGVLGPVAGAAGASRPDGSRRRRRH
jgi:uncharacterized protein